MFGMPGDASYPIVAKILADLSLSKTRGTALLGCAALLLAMPGHSHRIDVCWMLGRMLVCLPCLQGGSQRAGKAGEDAGQGQGEGGERTEAGEPASVTLFQACCAIIMQVSLFLWGVSCRTRRPDGALQVRGIAKASLAFHALFSLTSATRGQTIRERRLTSESDSRTLPATASSRLQREGEAGQCSGSIVHGSALTCLPL